MILAITPNVALDRTLVVPGYSAGGVFRPQQVVAAAGGKGLNVARAVRNLGGAAMCGGFIAGHTGALVASLAAHEGLDARWTHLGAGETRTCTILVDPALEQTSVVNESGAQTTADDWARLQADILSAGRDADSVGFCGSLPPGSPLDAFAALLAAVRAMGKPVWVDTSGAALQTAAAVPGIRLKINDDEAATLLDSPITDAASAARAALTLSQRRDALMVITLGARGAVISDGVSVWHAQPPTIEAKSAVGSGDSFLAGLLVRLAQGASYPDALSWATAAGAANALSIGGAQFTTDDFERMRAGTAVARL